MACRTAGVPDLPARLCDARAANRTCVMVTVGSRIHRVPRMLLPAVRVAHTKSLVKYKYMARLSSFNVNCQSLKDSAGIVRTLRNPTVPEAGCRPKRRCARVVEWGGLENRCSLTRTGGSNPSTSAHCHPPSVNRPLRISPPPLAAGSGGTHAEPASAGTRFLFMRRPLYCSLSNHPSTVLPGTGLCAFLAANQDLSKYVE